MIAQERIDYLLSISATIAAQAVELNALYLQMQNAQQLASLSTKPDLARAHRVRKKLPRRSRARRGAS